MHTTEPTKLNKSKEVTLLINEIGATTTAADMELENEPSSRPSKLESPPMAVFVLPHFGQCRRLSPM